MKKLTRLLACSLVAVLVLTQFKCVSYYPVEWDWNPVWTLTNLDNGGATPVLAASDEAPRAAYGIRLANEVALTPEDVEDETYAEITSVSNRFLKRISVQAHSSFDSLPPGSDLSAFFRARFEPGIFASSSTLYADQLTHYVSLEETVQAFNQPEFALLRDYHTDLLLLNPPPPGEYQFAVRLEFGTIGDPTGQVLDTLLVTNPIRLK